jgi:Fe-S cluster assembly ATP-binding protein
MSELVIRNLHAGINSKEILKESISPSNKVKFTLMGPNGTGKSTLAYVLMGHPSYKFEERSSLR